MERWASKKMLIVKTRRYESEEKGNGQNKVHVEERSECGGHQNGDQDETE